MIALLPLLAFAAAPAAQKSNDAPAPPPSSIEGLPIGGIARQQLPARGCAAYLWSVGKVHVLTAMASADPAQLRIALDGAVADYPRTAQHGPGGFGFDQNTTYQAGAVTAILDMTITSRADLTEGATVPRATLTIERPGKDTLVLPLGGLIGCAAAPEKEQ